MEQYNVLDLFCGCGGMSWGLAKKGFNITAGIDIWDVALKTYQHNHKNAKIINIDISDANPIDYWKLKAFKKLLLIWIPSIDTHLVFITNAL